MSDHVHTIAWATEGPLWFCACGEEFYPRKKNLSRPVARRMGLVRVVARLRG